MFRQVKDQIFVNTFAMDLYLPYDYLTTGYRGTDCYSVVGTKVRFYAVGNMRFYKDKKEQENPLTAKTYPLGLPLIVTSVPSEIDTREVQFVRDGVVRRCIVLTYYKDDIFIENTNCVKNLSNVMILMNRLEGGKLDHVPPEVAVQILQDVQSMNGVKLRLPSEEEEIFIAERYRNPDKHSQRARFAPEEDPDRIVSYNMRQDAMKTTTYQALTHEDINTSLITSFNRKEEGVIDTPSLLERVARGMDMSDVIAERDARLAAEKKDEEE